tara:strand:- start:3748 stop:4464 length:717 start_codon:yes stop_codon:yes gene_type:complete
MELEKRSSIRSQKAGVRCAWIFSLLVIVGWLGIGGFYAPFPADLGIDATKEWYTETNRWPTIIGCSILYFACIFLVPSSVQFGIMLSKQEGRWPLWSITVSVAGIFISLIIFLNACAWIVTAYRPETGADVIQSWNDWAWFAFLLGWCYLALEMIAAGVAELMDERETPMVPRWFTWFTFAGAFAEVTAMGPAFFKSGPFAYNGLFGFYMPMIIWGIYLNGTAYFMYRELNREAAGKA